MREEKGIEIEDEREEKKINIVKGNRRIEILRRYYLDVKY